MMSSHSAYSRLQKGGKGKDSPTPTPSQKRTAEPLASPKSLTPGSMRPKKQARFENGTPQLRIFESDAMEDSEDEEPKVEGEDSSSESAHSKIMAIFGKASNSHRVAAVLFDSSSNKLFVMEDTSDSAAYDQIYLLLEQLQPDLIFSSTKAPDALINRINSYCSLQSRTTLELLGSKLFTTAAARSHLAGIKLSPPVAQAVEAASEVELDTSSLGQSQTEASYEEIDSLGLGSVRLAILKMGCWVNVQAPLAICAMGAVISQVQQQRAFGALPGDDAGLCIAGIESLNLDQHMFITQETLHALEIFQPATSKALSRQSISLFEVMNTTRTTEGRFMLERWFIRPLTSLESISHRHDLIALFATHDNVGTVETLKHGLKQVNNTVKFMQSIRAGFGRLGHWKNVAASLEATLHIKVALRELVAPKPLVSYPLLFTINDSVSETMQEFHYEIMSQIDWITSDEESRFCFQTGVDDDMDELKERLAGLQPTLDHLASQIALSITSNYCRDLNVVCFPQLGYLLACTLHHPEAYNVNVPLGWELQFFSDIFYFKDEHMRDLDETFGDLQSQIQDREIDLTLELTKLLMVVEPNIVQAMDALAELDCVLALSQAVITYSLTRPRMVADNVLMIRQGRHLIQECLVDVYVPNNIELGADDKSMLLMTGANGSGKTAYGKMAALIVFMAQIGCFVPAASATIGVRTSILTCLNSRESVSSHSSSFMLQLQQISMTLRLANNSSLILVDELGKGTLPQDGSSLLVGILQNLLQSKALSIIITHFRPPMLPTEKLKQAHMQSIVSNDHSTPDISFLYQCQPGPSSSSHAGACAIQYGIPLEIVKRAHQASFAIAAHGLKFDSPPTSEEQARLRKADAVARGFLPLKLTELKDPMAKIKELLI